MSTTITTRRGPFPFLIASSPLAPVAVIASFRVVIASLRSCSRHL